MPLKLNYGNIESAIFPGAIPPYPLLNPTPAQPSAVRNGFAVDKSYGPLPQNPGYATGLITTVI